MSGSATDAWGSLKRGALERTEVGAARVRRYVYTIGGFLRGGKTTAEVARYDMERNR